MKKLLAYCMFITSSGAFAGSDFCDHFFDPPPPGSYCAQPGSNCVKNDFLYQQQCVKKCHTEIITPAKPAATYRVALPFGGYMFQYRPATPAVTKEVCE